jgi:hypothetical protein
MLFQMEHWIAPERPRGSSAMRRLVDGSMEVVAIPSEGFSPDALSSAMLRWPRTIDLTLNVGG